MKAIVDATDRQEAIFVSWQESTPIMRFTPIRVYSEEPMMIYSEERQPHKSEPTNKLARTLDGEIWQYWTDDRWRPLDYIEMTSGQLAEMSNEATEQRSRLADGR